MTAGSVVIREDRATIRKQWLALGGVVAVGALVACLNYQWEALALIALFTVTYVVNQARERVEVTDSAVVLVRTFWTRRVDRRLVRAVHRPSDATLRASLMLEGSRVGIVLPFGGAGPVRELADALGVPVADNKAASSDTRPSGSQPVRGGWLLKATLVGCLALVVLIVVWAAFATIVLE